MLLLICHQLPALLVLLHHLQWLLLKLKLQWLVVPLRRPALLLLLLVVCQMSALQEPSASCLPS